MLNETAERLNNQAITLASNGDYADAIACFKRAITIERGNSLLWFNLGLTYRDAGKIEMAKDALKKARALNGGDDETVETLAILCFASGEFSEALSWCAEGLGQNPFNAHLWNTMGVVFFNEGQMETAAEAFERAITLNPYYSDALLNLRDCYEELGNEAGAEECARQSNGVARRDEGAR